MPEHPYVYPLDALSFALGTIPALLWGNEAIACLGAPCAFENHMLIVSDENFSTASQRLRSAGFPEAPWSFFAREPGFYQGKGPLFEDIERGIIGDYRNLDQHSSRFLFPADVDTKAKVVLVQSSYVHLDLQNLPEGGVQQFDNILYPNAAILLQSMVQTLCITHLYRDLMLADDLLDSCDDEEAKACFNDNIRRYSGGIDRITHTKRLGRAGYDERLATQRDAPARAQE